MKIIDKIVTISMGVLMTIALYLMASIYFDLPLPKFYSDMLKQHSEERRKHDPLIKLGDRFIFVVHQRDSLQHIVDSLTTKP
jgi:hypothetical protein